MQGRGIGRLRQGRKLLHRGLDGLEGSGECPLHGLERQRRGPQPDLLVAVLEDERILAFHVAAARPAVPHVVTDHRLELECDMLDDVGRIRAALEARNEPATGSDAAAMLDETRHRPDERIGESLHLGR
jgi:hypothetical protein